MAHTPGPWVCSEFHDGHAFIYDADMSFIANVNCGDEDGKSNAHLIAAAPEMLAALQDLLVHADAECITGSSHEPIERARSMVAKATGQQS